MVEIEIGVLRSQCLAALPAVSSSYRRAPLGNERANVSGARIKWMFTAKKARAKWAAPSVNHCCRRYYAVQASPFANSMGVSLPIHKIAV
jgi:hypothetical protein